MSWTLYFQLAFAHELDDDGPEDHYSEAYQHKLRQRGEEFLAAWDNVIVHRHLGVVVVTRWTKYQRPSKRIGLGCGAHKIFQQAWVALAKGLKRQDAELNVEFCGLGVDLAAGPLDEGAGPANQSCSVEEGGCSFLP